MLRQGKAGTVLAGVGVWLAVALMALGAGLLYTELAAAQESSTEAGLSAPALTAEAGAGAVELRWEAVRYGFGQAPTAGKRSAGTI